MQLKLKAMAAWIFLVGMITVNAMANILPINGMNTGQISALYPNRFVPDGFTFSIWSLIYLLLIAFVVMGTVVAWKQDARKQSSLLNQLFPWFMFTCVLNAGWILAWHYLQTGLSVLIMLAFLFTLIRIYFLLKPHQDQLKASQRAWIYTPFLVYLGWISVATIANITAWLVGNHWGGFGMEPTTWSVLMILTATSLGLVFGWFRKDTAYALVIAWALLGIYRGQGPTSPLIGYVSFASALLLVAAALLRQFRSSGKPVV